MATTQMTVRSDRMGGLATMSGVSANLDSATDPSEYFTLPTGFGDCLIYGVAVTLTQIQTIVAAGAMRGPDIWIFTNTSKDFAGSAPWTRSGALSLAAMWEPRRPILLRQEESCLVEFVSEDTGVGDTSDLTLFLRVLRLRNVSP